MHIHKVVLRLPDSWSNWNFSEERGKPRSKAEKQQQTQTRYFGVEAGTWWEASALTRCAIPCYPRTPLLISAYCQLIAPKEEHVLRDGLLETLLGL